MFPRKARILTSPVSVLSLFMFIVLSLLSAVQSNSSVYIFKVVIYSLLSRSVKLNTRMVLLTPSSDTALES